jgi:hypothetical protein
MDSLNDPRVADVRVRGLRVRCVDATGYTCTGRISALLAVQDTAGMSGIYFVVPAHGHEGSPGLPRAAGPHMRRVGDATAVVVAGDQVDTRTSSGSPP